jgi:hypothetical protein
MANYMTWVDGVILGIVIIMLGLIVYFGFIHNREKGSCRNCPEANGIKGNRLLKDYKRKFRNKRKIR